MPRHTGYASLPLHGGKAPAWLFGRMVRLSREIIIYLVSEFGAAEVLRRLSDPFWFQAFGCVLGFDWHSSGVTTTVCGAVKEGIKDIDDELGLLRRSSPIADWVLVFKERVRQIADGPPCPSTT